MSSGLGSLRRPFACIPLYQLPSQAGICKWWSHNSTLPVCRSRNLGRKKASLPSQLQQKSRGGLSFCRLWAHVLLSTSRCGQMDTQAGRLCACVHVQSLGMKAVPSKSWAEESGMVPQGKMGWITSQRGTRWASKNNPRGCAEGRSRALPGRCLRDERNTAGGRKAPGGGDVKPLL